MTWKPEQAIRTWAGLRSKTNPAKTYAVLMYPDGSFSCNCPAWTNKRGTERICGHIEGIQAVYKLNSIDDTIAAAKLQPKTFYRRIRKAHQDD